MNNEIIQNLAYDTCDDFQHVNLYFHKFSFHHFDDKLNFKVKKFLSFTMTS
jgi:hypothetical protein